VKRYASVIRVRDGHEAEYRLLHENVWPEVREQIARSNIRNWSIWLRDGVLFSYFEYHGDDFAADMAAMAADREVQRWGEVTMPCQEPVETAASDDWWSPMEEVSHLA
jgi:L-rhamnose mutarotase